MQYKSDRFVPVMLKKAPRRRQKRGPTIVLALVAAAAVILVILLLQKDDAPFSTIVPTATPVVTVTPLPAVPEETPLPEVTPTMTPENTPETADTSAKNPVETLLLEFSESYTQARAIFDPLFERNSLSMLSFGLAMEETGGAALDPLVSFAEMEKGETPGEWEGDQATVRAESGSYAFEKTFSSGAVLRGTVSSAVTRLRFERCNAEGEAPYQCVELVRAANGFYGQVWQKNGLHQTVRFFAGADGLSCAMSSEKLDDIYEQAPVSWDAFAAPCTEALKASAGGALVRVGQKETICE